MISFRRLTIIFCLERFRLTQTKIYFSAFEKIKKKRAENLQIQEDLEKKLDKIKDVTKWDSILALTFDVNIDSFVYFIS